MRRIETHRGRVPWSWVGFMALPWVSVYYIESISNAGPLAFTLRKFVDDPALLGFFGSLNVAFNILVGVGASYMSDRVWTRWGRRRPFLIVGGLGVALCLVLIPLAPNLWMLAGAIVGFQFFADVAKPIEPLFNEVVPPPQRGRAATVRAVAQQLAGLFFFGALVAQFDAERAIAIFGWTLRIDGERTLYWTAAAVALGSVAFLAFFVRETPPRERVARETFSPKAFVREVFGKRQWLMLYLLYLAPTLASPGVETFAPLLKTEQLGFSKAEFGYATSVGLAAMIVVFIPLAGYLADRMPRLLLFQIGLVGPAIVHLAFYVYIRHVADYSISLGTLIGFGIAAAALRTCMFTAWGPLIFDYIPSDRFGTVGAGLTLIGGAAPFVAINLAGLWVSGFTRSFGPAGGGDYDYSSVYLLEAAGAALALLLTLYFAREERRGRVVPLGRLEFASAPAAARAG